MASVVTIPTDPPLTVSFAVRTLARIENARGAGVVKIFREIVDAQVTRPKDMSPEQFASWLQTDEASEYRNKVASAIDGIELRKDLEWLCQVSGEPPERFDTLTPRQVLLVAAQARTAFLEAVAEMLPTSKADSDQSPPSAG